jgi:TPR repeat protein
MNNETKNIFGIVILTLILLANINVTIAAALSKGQQADFDAGKAAFHNEDYKTAMEKLLPLAEQGYALAQNYVGVIYANGLGVEKDEKKGVEWYLKAANQNLAVAQDNLGFVYGYCDPNSAKRTELEIKEEADIHLQKFYDNLTDEEVCEKIRAEHEKRERWWLKELNNLGVFPALFICGAKHAKPFAMLISQSGRSCDILYENWSPPN